MAKKQKAPSSKSIENTALALWSKCVRAKQRTCRICGSDEGLQGHHIRSRTHSSTRFDLENGMALCRRCHIIQKFNPEKFQDNVISVIGDKEYQRLKKKSLTVIKLSTDDIKMITADLKDELRRIESDYGVFQTADEVL